MSYTPTQGGHSTFIPALIRASAAVLTYPNFTASPSSPVFPIEPGTKYINVTLDISTTTTETFYVRMSHSLLLEPNVPGGFDFIRREVFSAGPPPFYEQSVYEARFTGVTAPGGRYTLSFPLTNLSSKWGVINVACSNATSSPNVAITIVQGR